MSNSFYGGRDGAPMVIKKKYETIAEMLNDFSNINHPDLKFGDHVIIQSKNRNNPENGRIFRRSLDIGSGREIEHWTLDTKTNIFTSTKIDAQGAVLIGQIVGPSGNAPHLHLLSTKADVDVQYADFNNKPGYDVKIGDNDSEASTNKLGLGNLVPGKDGENFNDKITWRYCSVRDENQQETDAYIGFEIPYTIIEFEADSVSAYYHRDNETNNFINEDLVDRLDDTMHPFYQKWQINIPKGIHGQSFKNLRIVNEGTAEEPKQVLKYDYYDYDTIENPEAEIITLGDYNIIEKINLSDTGYLDIDTTASIGEVHQQLQWVKDITFDPNGTVVLHYIDGTTSEDTYENLVDWIKSIHIAQNGTVTVVSNNGTDLLDSSQVALQWIDKIALAENGKFTYGYNTEDSNEAHDSIQIKWPTNISVNNEGNITTQYNDEIAFPSQTSKKQLNWVTSATTEVEEVEGKNEMMFRMSFNNDNLSPLATKLTTPNEIKIDTGVVSVKYNSAPDTWVEIGRVDTVSSSAASEEEGADPNLGVGGVWFVTQEMEE